MTSYEVQVSSAEGWQIVAVFPAYDAAYDYARHLDREGKYRELRIQKEIEDFRTGLFRESTVYRGGLKVQQERQAEEERQKKEALAQKREYRRTRQLMARLKKVERRARARLHVQTHPVYLLSLMSLLFLLGMGTMYYFDHVLMAR
ncbi:MAG: hypothetical protein WD470_10215 [Rhodospirillaceae bacterium]